MTDFFTRKRLTLGGAGLVLLVISVTLVAHLGVPRVDANNVERTEHKIASNAPLLISFNQLMNRSSVEGNFSITPQIGGEFRWTLGTMTFKPQERFTVGQTYTVTIAKTATNILGKNLDADYTTFFTVVDPPRVVLAVPTNETQVDTRITVMFDRPMTELTTLDTTDARALPITITPALEGRFKWLGTSALQYIPKDRLAFSTEYTVTIPAGMNSIDGGTLEVSKSYTFRTPRIALVGGLPNRIDGKQPVRLAFNQAVNLDSLREHLSLMQEGAEKEVKLAYEKRTEVEYKDDKKIEKEVIEKSVALLTPDGGDFGYDNQYELILEKEIAGLEGNLTTAADYTFKFRTDTFVNVDRQPFEGANPFEPAILRFDQPVNLNEVKENLSFTPSFEVKTEYGKKCKEGYEKDTPPDQPCPLVDDETVVHVKAADRLPNSSRFEAVLKQALRARNGKQYLKKDYSWEFFTAAAFKILRTSPAKDAVGPYTYVCLFTTTQPASTDIEKRVLFAPAIKHRISVSVLSREYQNTDPCQPTGPGENFGFKIFALLDPDTRYAFTASANLTDIFGQRLEKDFVLPFKTEGMKDADTELDLMQRDFFAYTTLAQHAQPVFTARNLKEFTLEICKLSPEKVLDIDTQSARTDRYDPEKYGWSALVPSASNCDEYKTIQKKLPPGWWQKHYVEVGLEGELGHSLGGPGYYYIRASSPQVYYMQSVYDESTKKYVQEKVPNRPDMVLGVTDLHLAAKDSRDTGLFWVTDLTAGKPVKDAKIALYSSKGVRIEGESITDGRGIAKRALNGLEFKYAIASRGGDNVIVDSYDNEGIAPWDFNLNYGQIARSLKGYIYTERPLYQPTHEVFFKGILRDDEDARLTIPKDLKIEVEVVDSRETSIYKKELPVSAAGTFTGSLKLDEKASLGRYFIRTCLLGEEHKGDCYGENLNSYFFVEEYRKPEYKLEADFSQDGYINGQTLKAMLKGSYFFGAPVPGGKVTWSINRQNYYFDKFTDGWFSFTDSETYRKCYYGCPFNDENIASGEGVLNDNGDFVVTHQLDLRERNAQGQLKAPDSGKVYTLRATVQDKNNQSVSVTKSVIVHRGEFYVGIRNDEYLVKAGEKMPVSIISVDHNGQPVGGKSIKLELKKLEWKYVKKKNVDGAFYWDNEMEEKLIDTESVTTDSDGRAKEDFRIRDGGEYLVRATATDSLDNSFSSTADFYATTGDVVSWKRENNNRMELKLDKLEYKVGQTARVLVKSPYTGVKALVTQERGDIFSEQVIDIASNMHTIEVPVTERMLPNVFVSVMEVKGTSADSPPDFKVGYIEIPVDPGKKDLKISTKTDKERYNPRETVQLEIRTTDEAGKGVSAEVSVAAVDESLLALINNPERNLREVFYHRRYLGVNTASSMTAFLERVNVSDLKGAKGGSGKGLDEFAPVRGEFEDTAFWRSTLTTGADGVLKTSFQLPDNLTTWNIEVIGSTLQSQFGSANDTITTQKEVIVRPLLPRFALFGDELKIGGIVHNYGSSRANFKVEMKATNMDLLDSAIQNVAIAPGGSAKVLWKTRVHKVPDGTLATVTVSAGGPASDAVYQEFPVYSYSTPETVATSGYTDDLSFTEKVLIPESVDPEFGELKISTGATIATYLGEALNFLISFPYGCTEQVLSSIMPNIAVKRAINVPGLEGKLKLAPIKDDKGKVVSFDSVVGKSLQRVYELQRSDGGWGYFPGSEFSYPYLTAYSTYALDQIKRGGYSVDEGVVSRGVEYLRSYLRSNQDLEPGQKKNPTWAFNRSYILFAMAETGRGDIGLVNSLYDDRKLLPNGGKVYLALSLKDLNGAATKIDTLIEELNNELRIDPRGTYLRNDQGSSYGMMTNAKSTALFIQLLNRVNPQHPLMPRLLKWLLAIRDDGRWQTTQDTVTALIALTEFMEKSKEGESNYIAKILLNEKVGLDYKVDSGNVLESRELTKTIDELSKGGEGNKVVFSKEGTGRIYYDMILRYFLPIEEIAPRSEGIAIDRQYYRADDTKLTTAVKEAKAGETLRGRLTIVVPDQRNFVAVENFLPAGFELVNFEFANVDTSLTDSLKEVSEGVISSGYISGGYRKTVSSVAGGRGCFRCGEDGYYYGYSPWNHKELRNDRLFLFADFLSPGVYEYDYFVQVGTAGKFHHKPAVAYEMYFPETFGRTRGEWITVE